jgi:hypothetical protein
MHVLLLLRLQGHAEGEPAVGADCCTATYTRDLLAQVTPAVPAVHICSLQVICPCFLLKNCQFFVIAPV